ncbi:MAG: PSD1 and planctomycete cytochrome C domain-containing protein [Akkermansiaceae bacterium]
MRNSSLPLSAGLLAVLSSVTIAAEERVRFDRDIRPILSENCFACHGPDQHERKAKLRLDVKDGGIFEDRKGVIAVVPGKLDESELIFRLTTDDKEEVMPPPKAKKTLTPDEIALIKRWVAEGAEWEGHWAYELPRKSTVPNGAHPVDHFIGQRLEAEELKPSPAARPHTLLRRMSFDLTGLPPTPDQVAAFTRQAATDLSGAASAAVDRLLDSPRYGERMATFWLDLVRYADSIGYHSDTPMDVFLYREWVINSFNSNQRFDEFTRWQLAGDLLPNSTAEQKVASGYNRLLQTTEEGGAQPNEYVVIYAADRVRNISGAWLGGTLGCAQCHDHKFDPYTSKDFYSMGAFFADIKENPVGRRAAGMPIATASHKKRAQELEARIASLSKANTVPTPAIVAAQAEWEKGIAVSVEPTLSEWHLIGPLSEGSPDKVFKTEFGPEKGIDPKAEIRGKKWQKRSDFPDGNVHALPQDANSAWYLYRTINAPQATQLALSLGSDDAIRVWVNGEEKLSKNVSRGPAPDQEKITIQLKKGNNRFLMKIVNFGGGAGFYFKAGGSNVPAKVVASVKIPLDKRNDAQRAEVANYYLSIAPALADARSKLEAAKKEKAEFDKQLPRTLVTTATNPREMRILARGNWLDKSGALVTPAIPEFLGKLDTGDRRATRLDLANWVVDRENPLPARTFVNRVWKLFFGAGLSRNVDDLGAQGQWPSHPELLDWLAVDFVESGWDVKRLVRLLVTSQAYAQSSKSTVATRDRDPLNALLGRQARFRLDAEMVRDNALALGAILVEQIGGRSVKPYQPAGYWRHLNFPGRKWVPDGGPSQYRRAIYTHWQRSFLHPSLLAFDAPSREECIAERPRSNTPLQALVLLNDPTYVEAARAFGERIVKEGGGNPASRIRWAFIEAISRTPTAAELKVVINLHAAQLKRYQGDEAAAKEFLGVGMRPLPAGLPPADLASWTTVARIILNLHETITRQ